MSVARILWPAIIFALWMSPVSAATPSFDCTKAESSAEKLVCADEDLAKLDREVARLFTLARKGPNMTSERQAALIGTQRGWIKGRDDCWKDSDVRACVFDNYVIRIHELRQGYADARTQDASGISAGPVVVECPNFGALISATFVRTDLPVVYLAWNDMSFVLTQAPSGSGARYLAKYGKGEILFWEKGRTALFEIPGQSQLECQIKQPG